MSLPKDTNTNGEGPDETSRKFEIAGGQDIPDIPEMKIISIPETDIKEKSNHSKEISQEEIPGQVDVPE